MKAIQPTVIMVITMALSIVMISGESLQDFDCLDGTLDDTLIQIARLQKSIVTSQNSVIEQHVADLRADFESKIRTQDEKLSLNEKKVQALEKNNSDLKDEIYYLKKRLNKTEQRLANLSKDMQYSVERVNMRIGSVNSTLSDKLEGLAATVRTVKVNLASVQSDVSLLKKESVRAGADGKIDRAALPGSYADYSLEDLAWGSLHMAAVAACRGSVPSGGAGYYANAVVPVMIGTTCDKTCGEYLCDAAVTLVGYMKHATSKENVGYYYNYGCALTHNAYTELSRSDGDSLKKTDYMTYCCCRHPRQ